MKQNRNKQIVIDFYQKVIGERDLHYAEKIVTENYIQHNPYVRTGKSGFLEAIAFLKKMPRPKKQEKPFMRIIADNAYVVVHLGVELGGQKKNVLDVFRIEDGLLAEHWDAIQDQSESNLNGNSEIEGPILIENKEKTSFNKKIVKDFIHQVLVKRNFERTKDFIIEDLVQHNPRVHNGIKGLIDSYKAIQVLEVHRILGEGNFVVAQTKIKVQMKDAVSYDVFRLKEGWIVEHWNITQTIPDRMMHANGML